MRFRSRFEEKNEFFLRFFTKNKKSCPKQAAYSYYSGIFTAYLRVKTSEAGLPLGAFAVRKRRLSFISHSVIVERYAKNSFSLSPAGSCNAAIRVDTGVRIVMCPVSPNV
jgi:hypothetical protein